MMECNLKIAADYISNLKTLKMFDVISNLTNLIDIEICSKIEVLTMMVNILNHLQGTCWAAKFDY